MASKLGNNSIRNALSQIQQRFLQYSATHSSTPPLPNTGTSSSSSSSSFTVQFLVESCGLPLKSALSVSKKFQLDETKPEKPQSVLQLLKSHQFSDPQVAKLIVKFPQILHVKVENNLQPKLEYLIENGLAGELLPRVIVSNPLVLHRSLASHIKPCLEFLKSFLHSNDKIATAFASSRWLFGASLDRIVQPNVDFLMREGVPSRVIGKIILLSRVLSLNHETMIYAVNAVKNLGFEPNAPAFVQALKVMISMSPSTWGKKIEFMNSLGWNNDQILKAFKLYPKYLSFSEAKIKKALHFYSNTMKLETKTVVECPVLLGYSIDKRIRPRYNVLNLLESKKKLIGNKIYAFYISEKEFQKKYVDPYMPTFPGLVELYLGSKESKKIGA